MARETVEVPITGKIISVNVKAGDAVKEGDILCMLESMKTCVQHAEALWEGQ